MKKRDIARVPTLIANAKPSRYEHPPRAASSFSRRSGSRRAAHRRGARAAASRSRPRERDAFAKRLGAMEREGPDPAHRKARSWFAAKLDLIKGASRGIPTATARDSKRARICTSVLTRCEKVLHGDRVMVRESGVDRRGRREGTIVEVIDSA